MIATALGVFLVLAPKAALCTLGVWAAVIALYRYVSPASIIHCCGRPTGAHCGFRLSLELHFFCGLCRSRRNLQAPQQHPQAARRHRTPQGTATHLRAPCGGH
ncbi:MAG TPA: glycerol-3-phosphate acyltransferase [Desulfotomaculum sp.]|nr:glycerol-3-phosphate acyltransferase [Desulfotomaculum sp.]